MSTEFSKKQLFSLVLSVLIFCGLDDVVAADAVSNLNLRETKIALNWKPEAEFGGFYSAQANDLFKKHALKVDIVTGGAGTPSVQMVASSQFDFGIASADEIAIAQSHGAKVVAIFATYQTNTQGIMTHEERHFANLSDVFKSTGKLAMQKGLPYALYLQEKFASFKVQIVPYLGGISNFLVDKDYSQQCFVTSEPLSAEKKSQKVKTFLVADAGYNPYTTVLITREDVIKNKRELVNDVVAATREGLAEYLKRPDITNALMNKLNPSVDLETLRQSAEIQKKFIATSETEKSGLGSMTAARWSELVDQLLSLHLIKKKIPAEELFRNF